MTSATSRRYAPAPGAETPVLDAQSIEWNVDGHGILNGLSLTVWPGEQVGIVGKNGCGKSSFIKACLGLIPKVTGEVHLNGVDVLHSAPRDIAREAALLAQHTAAVVDMQARDVVELGRMPHRQRWVRAAGTNMGVDAALDAVGAIFLAERWWSTMSGGEKQRIQLARCIAQESPVLFVDEPTNHLDPGATWTLMQVIREHSSTMIGAFHDLNTAARFCSRIVVMQQGRIVADGSPGDVFTQELMAGIYGVEAQIGTHPDGGPLIIQTGAWAT